MRQTAIGLLVLLGVLWGVLRARVRRRDPVDHPTRLEALERLLGQRTGKR